jgi:CHAT domain-containing protein/tetratricopeptide (TPR) repeat protein
MQLDSSHPEPEVLAAFIAGNLTGSELEMTAEHLRNCGDCRLDVIEGARYDDVQQVPEPKRRPSWPVWLLAAAAALAGIGFGTMMIRESRSISPLQTLVAATPREGRSLEPRLTGGFPWAPLRPVLRDRGGDPDPPQMKLVGVAGEVIEETADDPSPDAQHAAAVAMLLAGSHGRASELLAKLATNGRDARFWSDLAAARYTIAVQNDEPAQLAQALAAVDMALRLDPSFAEAAFNRALILEHLGLREPAGAAWRRYLTLDGKSEWAREAERHLRSLGRVSEFRDELERRYVMLAHDPDAATALARRFPQEARVWGESEILDRWARAELDGNAAEAGGHLSLARVFGLDLRRRGEEMLLRAVEAIQRANPVVRRSLATAHRELREGQKVYRAGRFVEAEALFRHAAVKFEAGRSPMALFCRYFAANVTYDQKRSNDAREQLEQLLREMPPALPALRAHVWWTLGLSYSSMGRWGQGLDALETSTAGFEALGEHNYASSVREILSEALELLGDRRKAWNHRLVALRDLGRTNNKRLQSTIHAIARGAALHGDWPVSLSFINLDLELGRYAGDELMYVHTLLLRANVQRHTEARAAALDDLSAATAAITHIVDPTRRERAEAERMAVQGFLATSPESAVNHLSSAIAFERAKRQHMLLPELLLHRGRAFAAAGNAPRAADDFEQGIRELEDQRASLAAGEQRWGVFGAADELFDEAVALALRRSDAEAAFAYSERARARELLDSHGMTTVPAALPRIDDALVLEYVQLPGKLVIFVLDHGRIRAVENDVSSAFVAAESELLVRSAMAGDRAEFNRIASVLYQRLLTPVAAELESAGTLVVVPDERLALVPFAALRDSAGKYLIERHAVIVAPSVAVLGRLRGARRPAGAKPRLLMLAGPPSREGDLVSLSSEQKEVDAVAAEYQGNVDYAPDGDARAALERRSVSADVVHFVGHALDPTSRNRAALVTSRGADIDEQLDVRQIAAMRLRGVGVVVLAACGTARGYGRSGESSISLARAFLAAGVPSVVATLWTIEDDPAAEFFPRLHHHLVRGLSPAEAVRATQIEWLHRGDVSPAIWASIQIIGS